MIRYNHIILYINLFMLIIFSSRIFSQTTYSLLRKSTKDERILEKHNLPKGNCLAFNDYVSNISKYTGDVLFFEDFENGQRNWIIQGGIWEIGNPNYGPGSAYGGNNCAGTNLNGNYPDYANATLISPTIDLPLIASNKSLRIRYYSWYRTESDYDFIYLKVSTDNGQTWKNIASGSGDSQGWVFRDFSISSYAGKNIKVAFQLVSDGLFNYPGWYVDNISVELVDSVAIEVVVASNGQFTAGVSYGPILLYGHPDPWSSATTIRIDGLDYWNYRNAYWGDVIDSPKWIDELTNISTWAVADGIQVTQTIRIVKSLTTRIFDTMELRYKIVNTSASSHQAGIRIMLDTMLGTNDGAPFRVPGYGAITTDMEWSSNNMPPYFQAFDDLNHPTIQSQGTLIGGNATKPDRFVTTGWYNIKQTQWDYNIVPHRDFYNPLDGGFLDSAIGIYWFPVILKPGESKEFVTYYGLGGVDIDLQPPLVVGLSAPLGLVFLNSSANDNPFQLSVYLSNTSPGVTQTARGITTTLNLPDGLTLPSDETAVHNIPDMSIGAEQSTSYKIKALPNTSGNKTYSLTVSATNITTKTVQKNIYIWGITTSPVNNASVDVNTNSITAQFNVPLKSETINNSTFRVIDDFGNVLLSNVTYNSNERKAILTLLNNLSLNKNYKAILSSSIQSTDGVNLPNDVEWRFKTYSAEQQIVSPFLHFPLANQNPYNAPIVSVFDHSGYRYTRNDTIVDFIGETATILDPNEPPALDNLYSYKKKDGTVFLSSIVNYVGTNKTGSTTLNYDGHPGYDYKVPIGTTVFAAASGKVIVAHNIDDNASGKWVRIIHDNGYLTQYLHLNDINVSIGQNVNAEDSIGHSGNTGRVSPHLHFEVKKIIGSDSISVDPYGWGRNDTTDPYIRKYGVENYRLWVDNPPINNTKIIDLRDIIFEAKVYSANTSNNWTTNVKPYAINSNGWVTPWSFNENCWGLFIRYGIVFSGNIPNNDAINAPPDSTNLATIAEYIVNYPNSLSLKFGLGDGRRTNFANVRFVVQVHDDYGYTTLLDYTINNSPGWRTFYADLSHWNNSTIILRFITDPNGVSWEDWAFWADVKVEVLTNITVFTTPHLNTLPRYFILYQNYPNPFNPTTKIKYAVPKASLVTIKVYDVLGREITTIVNEEKSPGNYEVEFNATNLPSGVYFYKMQAGSYSETKKMVLMR